MTDPRDLDPFLDAAVAEAERASVRPPPSFAAVLARAHSLAPAAVPPPDAAPSRLAWPPGPRRSEDLDRQNPHTDALAPFLAAARGLADDDITARLRRPPPSLPRSRPRALPLALAAAAALILLTLGVGALRGVADRRSGALTGAQADATVRDQPRAHTPELRARGPAVRPEKHVLSDMPLETEVNEPAPVEAAAQPPPPAPRPQARAVDAIALELARLDDEAEALLIAGELDAADARYRQMIALGGRRRAVEHAYADRWLLARREGDEARHQQLLRAYLAKFPKGRFADDASAGLCRAAAASERPACWHDYRVTFPGGAYRREADEAAP